MKNIILGFVFAVISCGSFAFAQQAEVPPPPPAKTVEDAPLLETDPPHIKKEEGAEALEVDIDDALSKMKADIQKDNAKTMDPELAKQEM